MPDSLWRDNSSEQLRGVSYLANASDHGQMANPSQAAQRTARCHIRLREQPRDLQHGRTLQWQSIREPWLQWPDGRAVRICPAVSTRPTVSRGYRLRPRLADSRFDTAARTDCLLDGLSLIHISEPT